MDDAHAAYSEHDGVVYISCNLLQSIVQSGATYVYLRLEVQLALRDARVDFHGAHMFIALLDGSLELIGGDSLHLVQRHLAADVSDDDYDCLVRDFGDLADHAVALYANLFSNLERCRTEGLLSLLLCKCLPCFCFRSLVCLLDLSLLLPFLAGVKLPDLALYVVFLLLLLLLLPCCKKRHESAQFLSGFLGRFFFCL